MRLHCCDLVSDRNRFRCARKEIQCDNVATGNNPAAAAAAAGGGGGGGGGRGQSLSVAVFSKRLLFLEGLISLVARGVRVVTGDMPSRP